MALRRNPPAPNPREGVMQYLKKERKYPGNEKADTLAKEAAKEGEEMSDVIHHELLVPSIQIINIGKASSQHPRWPHNFVVICLSNIYYLLTGNQQLMWIWCIDVAVDIEFVNQSGVRSSARDSVNTRGQRSV